MHPREDTKSSLPSLDALQIANARTGEQLKKSDLFARLRPYLLFIADDAIDAQLQQKIAASDLVQQTLLEAHRDFAAFRGTSQEELLAWLKQILLHNLANARRRFTSLKRELAREQPLDNDISSSQDTPSTLVARLEETRRVEQAMRQLPEEYQLVLSLRSLQRLPFAEVGRRLDRTPDAARKLWYRAMQRLKRELI